LILVDSSVWIDYFNGARTSQTEKLDRLLGVELLAIGDLILAEVLQGITNEYEFGQVQRLLTALMVIDLGGKEIAIQAARNFRSLRAKGITVRKTIDNIIATHCIQNDHELLHSDRDFDPFVRYFGLRVITG
jgi:predicted nucleic acid-binding protein